MVHTDNADFLVEIGTEELPPKALKALMEAFARGIGNELERERLGHGDIHGFATPRRLAVLVRRLVAQQADRVQELRGPPVKVGLDAAGELTTAGRAFADKCGVAAADLGRLSTDKGEWISCRRVEAGGRTADLLPDLVRKALEGLPIPRRMRWGAVDYEFVRPVHWVLMLHGDELVQGSLLGVETGRTSRGHRFHAPGEIPLEEPAQYAAALEERGFVVADFAARKARVVSAVEKAASDAGGQALGTDSLYDEVTALTEWPVGLAGRFDESYLALPREVIIATLTSHQRCFPMAEPDGALLARFVLVANLASRDPEKVREGNERVIRPRLADAAFFWEQDRQTALADRAGGLGDIVYQKGLGSVADKSNRVVRLAGVIAERLGRDKVAIQRAATIAKCDLLTGMVGEFPELQGVMGRYYALDSGEPEAVADAIGEQYLPRFAGDTLPRSSAGQVLAVADRLDTLTGVFALGRKPSGNRDPFGLRRAALGIVRLGIEKQLDLDLRELLAAASAEQPVKNVDARLVAGEVHEFLLERLRSYYAEQGLLPQVFEAVRARNPESLPDFDQRMHAVAAFVELEPAASLAAANKRIANILRQAGLQNYPAVDESLLTDGAERNLFVAQRAASAAVLPLLEERAYGAALTRLAELKEPVDRFFDDVMVMTDDVAVKNNRLALLADLRAMFLQVADISRLSTG